MRRFKNVSGAVEYFRVVRAKKLAVGEPQEKAGMGAQCVLTGGPKPKQNPNGAKRVRTGFRARGVRVHSKGPLGNRVITVREFCDGYDHSPKRDVLMDHEEAVQWLEAVFKEIAEEKR
jgi:hypothetical protein